MMLPLISGLSAAAALLFAGYIFGVKKGQDAREKLREFVIFELNQAETLKSDRDKKIDQLLGKMDALRQVVEPLTQWDDQLDKLSAAIKQVQDYVLLLDQDAVDLTDLNTDALHRGDLTRLMDEIAEKAQFEVLLLSDENGLPIAVSRDAQKLDKLAAIASLAVIFGDRISRDGTELPQSFLIRYMNNIDTLCRLFHVGKHRLVLTAVSAGQKLTSGSLDPALSKVERIMATEIT